MSELQAGGPDVDAVERVVYRVTGLDCAEEVTALRRVLERLDGVDELAFDVLHGRMTVEYHARTVSEEALRQAVARTGMTAQPIRDADRAQLDASGAGEAQDSGADRRARLTTLSGLALAVGFALHALLGAGWAAALQGRPPAPAVVAYAVAILAGVWFVAPKAWFAARSLRPDMNLLMIVAVAGACVLGEWFEGASVSFLFALSLLLESWSVGRARRAVAGLVDLSPRQATVLHGGGDGAPAHEHVVLADTVEVGACVLVKPGERLPLDGRVVQGESAIDASPITGESVPVEVGPGDDVFAGTINGNGALELETTRPAGDTTLARIARLVARAQSRRSPTERFVERFARIYTPAVLVLALLTWLVPPLLFGGEWQAWIYNALVLLVIACPCALVISTPVSVVSGLASAARHGVLVKGGEFLELPARLTGLAIDKTGTLTSGRPVVSQVLPMDEHTAPGLLAVAASIESRSEHPLAAAIVSHARAEGVELRQAGNVRALPGQGVSGELDGTTYWLGSHRFLEARGQETLAVHETLERLEADGHTVVVLGNDRHVCGLITLRDEPRPEAARVVAELHALGLRPIAMLTGDNRATGRVIGERLGIDDVRAELLPEDKLAAVEALVAEHGAMAMVGDGVNDAPALARSSLGVAMGGAGTAAAIETADVVILSDDLTRLPWLVRHSRRTLGVIRQNIVASLAIKALFILLALGGWSTLWGAIAADMGVSLLVVSNALRLLRDPSAAGPANGSRG